MIAMLVFGFLSLILMPFLVSLTKTAIHRCAKCLNQVQDNSYFGMSSLEDKLFAWQFGSFGIILTRRTILYAVMILTAMLSIYVFILVEEAHIHDRKFVFLPRVSLTLFHCQILSTTTLRGINTWRRVATKCSLQSRDKQRETSTQSTSVVTSAGTAG